MVTPFRMTQDIHVEADTSKNCVNYPTSKFKSYTHCDEEFVYNMFQNEIGLMPFWVAKSMVEQQLRRFRCAHYVLHTA